MLCQHLRRRWGAQAALAWLLLALVVVPTLGRLHQIEHAGALQQLRAGHAAAGPAGAAQAGAAGEAAPSSATAEGHDHALPRLFSLLLVAHHAPADCLLLDQLALGDAVGSSPLALTASVPAPAPAAPATGRACAAHVALFQARGPPAA